MGCASSSPAANDAQRATQWQETHCRHQQQLETRNRLAPFQSPVIDAPKLPSPALSSVRSSRSRGAPPSELDLQHEWEDDARRETLPFVDSQQPVGGPRKIGAATRPPIGPKPTHRRGASPAQRGPHKPKPNHGEAAPQPNAATRSRPRYHASGVRPNNFRRVLSPRDPAYIAAASQALDTFQASVSGHNTSSSTGTTGSVLSAPSLTSNPFEVENVEL